MYKYFSFVRNAIYDWQHSKAFRNTVILATCGFLSQLLGMIRDILLAEKIGIGETLDIYYASFKVPDLIYSILFSVIAGVTIIPLLSKAIKEKNWHEVTHKYSALFNFFVMVTLVLCIGAFLGMNSILHIIFPHANELWLTKVSSLSRLMLIQPILLSVSNIFATLSMAENKFIAYGLAPLFYNFGLIIGVSVLYDQYGEKGLIWGVILGAAMNLGVQALSFWRSPAQLKLFLWDWKVVKEELVLALPRSLSLIMLQGRALFIASMSTLLGTGVLSAYTFANNFYMLPITALIGSIITVSFPRISSLYESGDIAAYYRKVEKDAVVIMLVSVFSAIVFYLFSLQIISIIYPHLNDKNIVSMMLSTLATTLPLYMMSVHYVRASFARRDAVSPLISQSLSVVSMIIALYLLYRNDFGILSIVYAFNISLIIEFIIIYSLFHNKADKL